MKYLAHIRFDDSGCMIPQTAADHCRNAARRAALCLAPAGLSQAGYLAALVHDAGKFKSEFQEYLLSAAGARGSVNHSFAGCRILLELFHGEQSERYEDVTAELLAYAAGAHHGLFDCVDENSHSGFLHRMTKADIGYEESVNGFLGECAERNELNQLFFSAHRELLPFYQKFEILQQKNTASADAEISFYLGLTARLLLSSVIEGDRRDTAGFMNPRSYHSPESSSALWKQTLSHMEKKLEEFPQKTDVDKARRKISGLCRSFAEKPGGIYCLNVPTGSGKTLSALRYALAHAAHYEKRRIIFTAPLLTILDQNSTVIREFVGDDSLVLEHHSNVIRSGESPEEMDKLSLAEESWTEAPILITTMVQLLETLFSGRTGAIRRFQALCGSVIVIDEVQTVPARMLSLFNLAMNFLAEYCGATVLLCSATQPRLDLLDHPLLAQRETPVPYDETLWRAFRRTDIRDAGSMSLEEISHFAETLQEEAGNVLVVCNKRSEAETLYRNLSERGRNCRHLSASMCAAHRRSVLNALMDDLAHKRPVICVSTQVIEAGVDISFARVIRLTAGMDSIVQSAGRCNRHGENPLPAPVYAVECQNEKLGRLPDIQRGKNASLELLDRFQKDPARFGGDLTSDEAITYYYRALYRDHDAGFCDFNTAEHGTLLSLLAGNVRYLDQNSPLWGRYTLNQAFALAGKLFTVFGRETEDVVVPFGEGEQLIQQLREKGEYASPEFLRSWAERAKPYTVSLYEYQKKDLVGLLEDCSGIRVLTPGIYREDIGFSLSSLRQDFLEV